MNINIFFMESGPLAILDKAKDECRQVDVKVHAPVHVTVDEASIIKKICSVKLT